MQLLRLVLADELLPALLGGDEGERPQGALRQKKVDLRARAGECAALYVLRVCIA